MANKEKKIHLRDHSKGFNEGSLIISISYCGLRHKNNDNIIITYNDEIITCSRCNNLFKEPLEGLMARTYFGPPYNRFFYKRYKTSTKSWKSVYSNLRAYITGVLKNCYDIDDNNNRVTNIFKMIDIYYNQNKNTIPSRKDLLDRITEGMLLTA